MYRRIIRAAEELFKKSGFRGVTMEAVARDAAVSKATLYSHFKNKDELFLAVCVRMAQLLSRAFGQALAGGQSLDERVSSALLAKHRLTFILVRRSPHAEELFSHKAQFAGEIFARADDDMLHQLADALAEEEALEPSARQLARALFLGSGELAARTNSLEDLETDLAAFVQVHLGGARALARTTTAGSGLTMSAAQTASAGSASTADKNKQIAREFFARFTASDIPGALDLLSSDARWWLSGKPELMRVAGWYTKDEIAQLFQRMMSRLKNGMAMTVKGAIAEGDLVALEVESHGELDNGRRYNNEYHTLMRLSDGKIREVKEYSDTQHAHAVWLER